MDKYNKKHYDDMADIIYDSSKYAEEWGGAVAKVAINTVRKNMVQLFEADSDSFDRVVFNMKCNGIRLTGGLS